jgi:hypothetical protein
MQKTVGKISIAARFRPGWFGDLAHGARLVGLALHLGIGGKRVHFLRDHFDVRYKLPASPLLVEPHGSFAKDPEIHSLQLRRDSGPKAHAA